MTLGIRSTTWALAGKFGDAHQEAELMVKTAPFVALGYLCKGQIYALEGRQAAAIRVFEEGIINAFATDPDSEALKQAIIAARIQNAKCVDFVTQLPPKILPRVLNCLPSVQQLRLRLEGVARQNHTMRGILASHRTQLLVQTAFTSLIMDRTTCLVHLWAQ